MVPAPQQDRQQPGPSGHQTRPTPCTSGRSQPPPVHPQGWCTRGASHRLGARAWLLGIGGRGGSGGDRGFQLHTCHSQGLGKAAQPSTSPWPFWGNKSQSRLRSEERSSSLSQGREERAEGTEIPPRTRSEPLTGPGGGHMGQQVRALFSLGFQFEK